MYRVFIFICISSILAAQEIRLPEPKYKGEISVEEAIFNRRSIREFKDEALSLEEVSQLIWAAGGKNIDGITGPTRSYPSAGGIYPIEIYLVAGKVKKLDPGIYKYNWEKHSIKLIKKGDFRKELTRAALGQPMVADAPISIVFTAIYSKTESRYGQRGRERYVPMDVGHAGQNVELQAVALKLGTVVIGAFRDEQVKKILDTDETPLYIMPIGKY